MRIDELKYTLEGKNIATEPREVRLGRRDLGRMLVIDRKAGTQFDSFVQSLADYLNPGDTIILNDSKRVNGILKGNILHNKAQIEIQLVEIGQGKSAICRIYPTHHLKENIQAEVEGNILNIASKRCDPHDLYEITSADKPLIDLLKELGYPITSFFYSRYWEVDFLNPFFAKNEGSIESPLAGLHFTPELVSKLTNIGINFGYVTLHSVGSWLPFAEETIEEHVALDEWCCMPVETAELINLTKRNGNKVIACGSTAMRTMETAAVGLGKVKKYAGKTGLYIKPGYQFRIADHYFTNFHPYKTSLMVLDAAFCGSGLLLESYQYAKESDYLFFEFGDAILYL